MDTFQGEAIDFPFNNEQTSAPDPLPSWELEALRSHAHIFRPLIRDFDDMHEKEARYLSRNDKENTRVHDIPTHPQQLQGLIQRLWEAFYNTTDIIEPKDSQPVKAVSGESHWTEGEVHLALWKLLNYLVDAQRGICKVPASYTRQGPVYEEFDSFQERFDQVENALRESKATCRSLFSLDIFTARLAWNPGKESKRKSVNKALNIKKNTVQAVGLAAAEMYKITRGADGKLRDENGYILNKKIDDKPTHTLQKRMSGVKKRNNSSVRAKVNKQMEYRLESMVANAENNDGDNESNNNESIQVAGVTQSPEQQQVTCGAS